jgi:hypothetical protein
LGATRGAEAHLGGLGLGWGFGYQGVPSFL